MTTHIYLIENIEANSNKVYIGKTKDSNKHNRKYTHKQTYGKQISFTIIDSINSLNRKDWRILESYWIEQFKIWGFNVINKNNGGGGPEFFTEESKNKLSISHKGRKISQETKTKISNALKGRKKSQEHRNKIKNRIISQKQIDNIRKAKCKAVIQYDKQGNYINEFNSLIEAAHILKINYQNLSQHARGYKGCNKTIGGYIFKQKQ
jgi:hypothetical protein